MSDDELRACLFESLGAWSVEICRPDAELAPPQYLLDAISAVFDRLQAAERDAALTGWIRRKLLDAAVDAAQKAQE